MRTPIGLFAPVIELRPDMSPAGQDAMSVNAGFGPMLFEHLNALNAAARDGYKAGHAAGRREALAETRALRDAVAEILPHLDQAARRFEGCYGEPYYAGVRNGVIALRKAMEGKDKS